MGRDGIKLRRQAFAADVTATYALAHDWAPLLQGASLLLLEGSLGAGKTSFIKGLVQAFAITSAEEVTSPTFALLHEYRSTDRAVYHFDLYRLRISDDFIALGFEDYLYEEGSLCCVEWPDKINDLLPVNYWHLEIETIADGRLFKLSEK